MNSDHRTKKGGLDDLTSLVSTEAIGALVALIIIAFLLAFFFNLFGGCSMNKCCMQSKNALEQLTKDLNKACEDSTLETSAKAEELGEYDFCKGTDYLIIGSRNKLKVGKINKEMPLEPFKVASKLMNDPWSLLSTNPVEGSHEWQVSRTADSCNIVWPCGWWVGADKCGQKLVEHPDANWVGWGVYPFWSQKDTKGRALVTTPLKKEVTLKWAAQGSLNEKLCDSTVSGFCSFAEKGTDWAKQYPKCEKHKSQIDNNGNTVCDGESFTNPNQPDAETCAELNGYQCMTSCPTTTAGAEYDSTCNTGSCCKVD